MNREKILVVEDEPAVLKLLMDQLSKEGFLVIGAQNGKEGLETALKEIPDLILLDILMPEMDGMEMLERLRNNTVGAKVPVIFLSNLGETSKMLQSQKLGAVDYIIKTNFKLEDVMKAVKEELGVL